MSGFFLAHRKRMDKKVALYTLLYYKECGAGGQRKGHFEDKKGAEAQNPLKRGFSGVVRAHRRLFFDCLPAQLLI
jgi:hypothetical protein